MTSKKYNVLFSVVSHGHGYMIDNLLSDINKLKTLANVKVILTLNIPEAAPKPEKYSNICLKIIRNKYPKGFGCNHNAAFKEVASDYFCILNPDIRIFDDFFGELLAKFELKPKVALVAPLVINSKGDLEDSVRENLTPLSLLKRHFFNKSALTTDSIDPARFYWYAGMFMLVRSPLFKEISGFDEKYFLYCEDYDLCARLFLLKRSVVQVKSAHVIHDAQRDSRRSLKYFLLHLVSLVKVWLSSVFWKVVIQDLKNVNL